MPPSFPSLLTAALALATVLGLILLIAASVRRTGLAAHVGRRQAGHGRAGGATRLALEASLALDPRRRLHLLRCADRQVLLLTGGPQDLLLGWLPPPEPTAPAPLSPAAPAA